MYLLNNPNTFNQRNIILTKKTQNNIINDAYFNRIIYSNDKVSFNCLIFCFSLENVNLEVYYKKMKCFFNYAKNKKNVDQLIKIEKLILDNFTLFNNKTQRENLNNSFKMGNIKIHNIKEKFITKGSNKNIRILLRISGIWSTKNECGISYKFIIV